MKISNRSTLFSSLALVALAATAQGAASSLHLYGQQTPGSAGLSPRIWALDTAYPGNSSFGVRVDTAIGNGTAFLLVGAQTLDLFGSGFHFNVLPFYISPPLPLSGLSGSPGAGAVGIPLPIPNNPALMGFDAYFQFVVSDPGASYGYAATRGLRTTITDSPLVIAVGSTAGAPDPVFTIDPLTGAITNWSTLNGGVDVVISPDGTLGVISATLSKQWAVMDMSTGTILGSVSTTGSVNSAAITPDGKRAYGVAGSPASANNQEIVEIDLDPASPTFAQKIGTVSGYPLALKQWEGVSVSADGKTLVVANLGLGDQAAVIGVDIDSTSVSYNLVTNYIPFYSGGFVTDVVCNYDGTFAFASLAYLASHGDMAVIDLGTNSIVTIIGSIGMFPTDIDLNGLEDYAFIACPNSDSVARVNVNPADPGYLTWVSTAPGTVDSPFAVALSPDCDKVYCCEQSTSYIREIDATTMTVTNAWQLPKGAGSGIAAR